MEYTATGDNIKATVNTVDYETTGGTFSQANSGSAYFGGNNVPQDIEIDYLAFYDRVLTADEKMWLYNSGGTRTYAELD